MLRCLTLSICLLVFDALLQQGVHHAFGMEDLISHRLSLLAPCWLIQAFMLAGLRPSPAHAWHWSDRGRVQRRHGCQVEYLCH